MVWPRVRERYLFPNLILSIFVSKSRGGSLFSRLTSHDVGVGVTQWHGQYGTMTLSCTLEEEVEILAWNTLNRTQLTHTLSTKKTFFRYFGINFWHHSNTCWSNTGHTCILLNPLQDCGEPQISISFAQQKLLWHTSRRFYSNNIHHDDFFGIIKQTKWC